MLVILLVKIRPQQKVLPANNAKQRQTLLRFARADDSATPARNRSSQALLLSSGHQLWFKGKRQRRSFHGPCCFIDSTECKQIMAAFCLLKRQEGDIAAARIFFERCLALACLVKNASMICLHSVLPSATTIVESGTRVPEH